MATIFLLPLKYFFSFAWLKRDQATQKTSFFGRAAAIQFMRKGCWIGKCGFWKAAMIVLLTDFGQSEYVGVIKGVIYRIHAEAKIVDLCHDVKGRIR